MPGKKFLNPNQKEAKNTISIAEETHSNDFSNSSYLFEGATITLIDGIGEIPSDPVLRRNVSTIEVTGVPLLFDINNDTVLDTVFLLKTKEEAYYLTASISLNKGYIGLNMLALGKDIASTTLIYKNGGINFLMISTKTNQVEQRVFIVEDGILKERR